MVFRLCCLGAQPLEQPHEEAKLQAYLGTIASRTFHIHPAVPLQKLFVCVCVLSGERTRLSHHNSDCVWIFFLIFIPMSVLPSHILPSLWLLPSSTQSVHTSSPVLLKPIWDLRLGIPATYGLVFVLVQVQPNQKAFFAVGRTFGVLRAQMIHLLVCLSFF